MKHLAANELDISLRIWYEPKTELKEVENVICNNHPICSCGVVLHLSSYCFDLTSCNFNVLVHFHWSHQCRFHAAVFNENADKPTAVTCRGPNNRQTKSVACA